MIKKVLSRISLVGYALISAAAFGPSEVLGQGGGYVPLSRQIPFIGEGTWPGIKAVLNGLLGISVGIAAILAVIMLAVGGFKYMTTDSVFSLGNAKEQIANAIIGLLIVLTAILVLRTINPEIVSLRIFE